MCGCAPNFLKQQDTLSNFIPVFMTFNSTLILNLRVSYELGAAGVRLWQRQALALALKDEYLN